MAGCGQEVTDEEEAAGRLAEVTEGPKRYAERFTIIVA
jgi:hypothetical protein